MRTTIAGAALVAAVALTGCSSTPTPNAPAAAPSASTTTAQPPAADKPAGPLDAKAITTGLGKKIPTMKTTLVYTEDTDPNHLLGRPGSYTSKTAFSDSRVKAAEVEGLRSDAIERGGSVEVFSTAAEAHTRAEYIGRIGKAMPAAVEYDYVSGTALVRVSRILTPTQARAYEAAAKSLG
ncbi:hypothetical protein [Streptomyces sp. RKAG337]|uniref:hypothetical protein n=1 Tax=Streptomyces sp. RKAG337 TaxID=2893404 RepID=UPI0020349FBF|nr:hypothetical protein [Streptomyces sp. RKAG337]MCM2427397.1 hypothetical protein [Streptomyces sp. RKAG337]